MCFKIPEGEPQEANGANGSDPGPKAQQIRRGELKLRSEVLSAGGKFTLFLVVSGGGDCRRTGQWMFWAVRTGQR